MFVRNRCYAIDSLREEAEMKECILVVDDDPEIVGAIAIALEREGYEEIGRAHV